MSTVEAAIQELEKDGTTWFGDVAAPRPTRLAGCRCKIADLGQNLGGNSIEIPWENEGFQGCMSPSNSQQYSLIDVQRERAQFELRVDLSMWRKSIEIP